jgi:hypothetical protein
MSDSASTPLPISGSTSVDDGDLTADLDLSFDGADNILRCWRRGMRPDEDLTVSKWADQHFTMSSWASAEPGQYRTSSPVLPLRLLNYTPSPAEAEFDVLTAGFRTIQLFP